MSLPRSHLLLAASLAFVACQGVDVAGATRVPDRDATDDVEGAAEKRAPLARPRLERDGDAGVDLVYQGRGIDGVAVPGRVVVLEPDFEHVHGIEPGSGDVVWRRRLALQADGAHAIVGDGYRVLIHAGRHLVVLDARDGRILGRNDDIPPSGRHRVVTNDGACAIVGPCSLEVIDCVEAETHGPLRGSDDAECRYRPRVLGHAADASIVLVPDGDAGSLVATPTSGTPRWTVGTTAAPDLHAGVVDGLDVVWVVDDARVLVRRASTGQERWQAPLGLQVQRVEVAGELLVVIGKAGRRTSAVAFELDTGHERWRRRLGSRRVALLQGDDPRPVATGAWRTYEILAPQTGEPIGRIAAARDETLWADVDDGYLRTDGTVEELGPDGALLRLAPFTGVDVLSVGATHLVARAGQDLLFYDRLVLRERARLRSGFDLDPSSGELGPHRVLLRRPDEAGVLFVVVALEPVSRRRVSDTG